MESPKIGKDGLEVARRLRLIREHRGFTIRELSEKMSDLGRPLLPSGIVKIEQGGRRVDVDDLTCLAIALEVDPPALLSGDFGSFENLEREQVDLTALRAHRPELGPVAQAVNGALAAGVRLEEIQAFVKLAAVMHEMTTGSK